MYARAVSRSTPTSHASRNSTRTETVDEDQEESFCLDDWEDWMDLSHSED